MTTPLVIRADAGSAIGTGHVMRMIALAQAVMERGTHVTILSAQCQASIIDRVKELGITHALLPECAPGSTQDAKSTLDFCQQSNATWLVLDGYHFGEAYQKSGFNKGIQVLALDDFGHCATWYCDAILDQNLGAEHRPHGKSHNPDFTSLLGSPFALIRSEFKKSILNAKEKLFPANNIVITMGGADQNNVTSLVLDALENICLEGLHLRVLVGGSNPHSESIQQRVNTSKHNIEILNNVRNMPAMYEWADAIISAGGSTCWEWLAYGLPGAVVTLADNQEPVVAELKSQHLALSLGWFTDYNQEQWSQELNFWLSGDTKYSAFAQRRNIIDGYGADRVAAFCSADGLWSRPAMLSDAKLYFDWANDPIVRTSGFHTNELIWENHCVWFQKMIQNPDTYLYLVSQPTSVPIGQVRLTPDPSGYLEIGFSLDHNYRGHGLGTLMLKHVIKQTRLKLKHPHQGLIARVKRGNLASEKAFTTLGFTRVEDDPIHDCLVYTKEKL